MKIVAIIQARMGSTRLHGKIMKEVLGKPLLEYQIERVKRSKLIDQIVIATTTKETEKPIIDLCRKLSIPYYRGSEENVLSRYYEAAKYFKADIIVRLTSDCPIIDPAIVDKVINAFLDNEDNIDYASNTLERTYPRGMDTEVFTFNALESAYTGAKLDYELEHVTPFFYEHPNKFKLRSVINNSDESNHRWTVDTNEDFILIKKIIKTLYNKDKNFTFKDVLKLLENNKSWMSINTNIKQKGMQE